VPVLCYVFAILGYVKCGISEKNKNQINPLDCCENSFSYGSQAYKFRGTSPLSRQHPHVSDSVKRPVCTLQKDQTLGPQMEVAPRAESHESRAAKLPRKFRRSA
jgi:hypothetical protein